MESSHFLAICFPWQKLENVVLRFWISCHGNEIWAIFAKISDYFLLFVFLWNRAIFGLSVHHDPLYKTLFLHFWFRPLMPKIYSPKFAQNSACTGLYDRQTGDVWAYQGVFGDGLFNGTIQNVVGPTLVAMATKFGLGSRLPACWCVCVVSVERWRESGWLYDNEGCCLRHCVLGTVQGVCIF